MLCRRIAASSNQQTRWVILDNLPFKYAKDVEWKDVKKTPQDGRSPYIVPLPHGHASLKAAKNSLLATHQDLVDVLKLIRSPLEYKFGVASGKNDSLDYKISINPNHDKSFSIHIMTSANTVTLNFHMNFDKMGQLVEEIYIQNTIDGTITAYKYRHHRKGLETSLSDTPKIKFPPKIACIEIDFGSNPVAWINTTKNGELYYEGQALLVEDAAPEPHGKGQLVVADAITIMGVFSNGTLSEGHESLRIDTQEVDPFYQLGVHNKAGNQIEGKVYAYHDATYHHEIRLYLERFYSRARKTAGDFPLPPRLSLGEATLN